MYNNKYIDCIYNILFVKYSMLECEVKLLEINKQEVVATLERI